MRVGLISNPRSAHGGIDLSDAILVMQAQGWFVDVWQKMHKGDATELARRAAREGYDIVCDCGGDGTLSEIVDGLAGTDVAVGAIPGGTVNVWAREMGLSQQPRVAATQLVNSHRVRVDVGHVTIDGAHGQHFLLMAGLGLDAAVMDKVSRSLKNRIGPLAVGVAAVEAVPAFRTFFVRAELDDLHWQGRVTQVVVGNTRRYGGFTRITPGAFMTDGLLDVCFITSSGSWQSVRQIASLLMRRRPSDASAETYRVRNLTIRSPTALPLQLDGSAIAFKHSVDTADGVVYEFSAVPEGVTIMVPNTYDGELFGARLLTDAELHSVDDHGKRGKKLKKGKAKKARKE